MNTFAKDPLMGSTRTLLAILFWVLVVIGTLGLLMSPIMALNATDIETSLARKGLGAETSATILALTIAIGSVMALAIAWLVTYLRKIVATVADGDPFVPDNASRLRKMGWIAIGIEALTVLLALAATHVDGSPQTFDFDGGALILALCLFILARVFRQGAAMRDDLEGTV